MKSLIRELQVEDLRLMIDLRLELLRTNPENFGSSYEEEKDFSEDKWIKRITNPNTKTFGVFVEDDLVGIGVLALNPRKKMKHIGIINSVYIKEDYRRMHLASSLFAFLEEEAKKLGIVRLHLSVMEDNKAAIHFYEKHGFILTGKELERIYVNGNYHSLSIMSKRIDKKS